MRIRGSSLSKTDSGRAESTRGVESRAGSSAPAPTGNEDTVATGRQSELVSQTLQVDTASRNERVHELKSALDAGTYQADAAEVSRALVAEALVTEDR